MTVPLINKLILFMMSAKSWKMFENHSRIPELFFQFDTAKDKPNLNKDGREQTEG